MKRITIGFDPGKTGAYAFLHPSGDCTVHSMPVIDNKIDVATIRDHIDVWREGSMESFQAWVEEAQPMAYSPAKPDCTLCGGTGKLALGSQCPCRRRQGLASSFHYAKGAGLIVGCLIGMDIDCNEVAAKTWQRAMLPADTPRGRKNVKAASILAVHRRHPTLSLRRTSRCKVDSPDMADAVNIAGYGSRITVL